MLARSIRSLSALFLILLASCSGGGGGGGGGDSLTLALTPATVVRTYFVGDALPFSVIGRVGGEVSGVVNVVVRDTNGVIQPNVTVQQLNDSDYEAQFITAPALAAGRHQGSITVDLCADLACGRRYGGSSFAYDFTVLATPVATSLAPVSVVLGDGDFTLTVNGTGFQPESRVQINFSPRPTTYVSPTQLTASISQADIGAAGPAGVRVDTQVSSGSLATSNTVNLPVLNPAPVISSLSPAVALVDSPQITFQVNGSGFLPASRIFLNGVERPSTTYLGSTQLASSIGGFDELAGGTIAVTVVNPAPGGGTSNAELFTVANRAPVLSSIDPGSSVAGCGATTIAATGSGFAPGATLNWNGSPRPTTYESPDRLLAVVSPTDLAGVGGASVTVTVPAPGGGTTTARTFTVAADGPTNTPATSYQNNVRHDGQATVRCRSSAGATPTWTYDLPGIASTPIIADGRVFVRFIASGVSSIVGLDLVDGSLLWGPIDAPGQSTLAWDNGRLFVADWNGSAGTASVKALDPATGGTLWTTVLDGTTDSAVYLTAGNGLVFGSRNATGSALSGLFALDQSTGLASWNDLAFTSFSIPAIDDGSVFVSSSCDASRRDAVTGDLDWDSNVGCSGGVGGMPVLAGTRVYSASAFSSGWVRRDAASGTPAGSFGVTLGAAPAFNADARFVIESGQLTAYNLSDDSVRWTTSNLQLDGSPMIVNDVVIASDGTGNLSRRLYFFATDTGATVRSIPGAGILPPSFVTGFGPVGHAVGDGWLLVPYADKVQAFRISAEP